MLEQGLILMAAGMGTVTVFLTLTVFVMQVSGAYFRANEERFMEKSNPMPRTSAAGDENEIVAAALAAVAAHSKSRGLR
ncbi:MAG TPA: OadG family protein [Acidobacteriota bacterium]|nr:OadG family protein [Acidobacteriota bacterium]